MTKPRKKTTVMNEPIIKIVRPHCGGGKDKKPTAGKIYVSPKLINRKVRIIPIEETVKE
jgi:hypothetical protein